MKTGILVTGASGLLGTEIIRALLRKDSGLIFALARGENKEKAMHRLRSFWWEEPDLYQALGDRVRVVCGDITQEDLGMTGEEADELASKVSVVIHAAAETGVQRSRHDLREVNTKGTKNAALFARRAAKSGGLERFVYISTAYVAGEREGRICENDPLPDAYATYYEESKADAEKIVRRSGVPFTICRPGMIIGNSVNGRTRNFNTIYYVMKLMMQGRLPVIPVRAGKKVNAIPADDVAEAVVRLMRNDEADGGCFHLTVPEEKLPSAGELAEYICEWAEKNLNVKLRKPVFTPVPFINELGRIHNRKPGEKEKQRLSNLLALSPYFYDDRVFDRTNTDRLLGPYEREWRSYTDAILEYACRRNFLHNTDRNVFEQALFRQQSRSAPISYYDVSAKQIKETTGEEMRGRILTIAAALEKLGIRKGDKAALTGNNCTDYFALDAALGLRGAVSVPVYYTTPVSEIDILLEKSGAKWLFVGDRRIMEHIDELKSGVSLISFSTALTVTAERADIMPWEQFLALAGPGPHGMPDASADPDDLATIRYTSGTTGEPKGVMFNAGQLKWMGQVMTALLPWKDRQSEMRYLSFLPLSHVVEGILASYAPYYVHCPVKFYYLNRFEDLTQALPKVRPTVFFSVPRFYEKLWQQIEENPAGQRYLAMPEGPAKKIFGAIVRRSVLKKAGLDCCAQLIVGSAPVSGELLLKFRALGIEIHNAYGQTEAPLITINRLGDNVIPTIGTPLPETEVTITDDGELIVRGPQVCLGYYRLETDTIREGVLRTGDLGEIGGDGHITLIGRKKEMIITSYGKNISCPKIEERLKDIPGVSEAVLIGENRPFCSALIWTDREIDDLDARIGSMNRGLSHPEQIRRWKVIRKPLSIQAGELTPNLKVRRAVVEEHYRDEISEFYNEKAGASAVAETSGKAQAGRSHDSGDPDPDADDRRGGGEEGPVT